MEISSDFEMICEHYLDLITKIEKLDNLVLPSKDLQKEMSKQLHRLEKEIMLQFQIHMK